ncbi:MAG: HAMP domain-containing protein, partial [Caulobacteraceae bacterium]|nr:HAMP domain-containing protein [Caulobacteraceae bacterium]
MSPARSAPLFLQTLGLVIASLVAAQVAAILVIFSLPPPTPDIVTVEEVAAAVSGVGQPGRPTLAVSHAAVPPATRTVGRRRLAFRAALAEQLGVDPGSIVISQRGSRPVIFGMSPHAGMAQHMHAAAGVRVEPVLFGHFEVGVRRPAGDWLIVQPRSTFGMDPWRGRLLLVFALAVLGVAPLAWVFARRLTAPISALAAGAQRLGQDPNAPPLVISGGSREVATAVAAYNEMQDRLRRYVEDRTAMVAAIAHDLRTPLMRLSFRVEQAPEDLRTRIGADIEQMDAMIAGALSFLRDIAPVTRREPLELASLVETVLDEAAEVGGRTGFGPLRPVVVEGDPLALKRLVCNLVDNALKFGGEVRGAVVVEAGWAVVRIEDRGP